MLTKNGIQSCDQCNFQRIRCCQVRPSCETCVKKGLKCTWNREPKGRAGAKYQNIETFRAYLGSSTRCRWIKKIPSSFTGDKKKTLKRAKTDESIKWYSSSPRRHLVEYFKVQINFNAYPLSNRATRNLARALMNLPLYYAESYMPLQVHITSKETSNYCYLACFVYFNQIHPFFNIFSREGSYYSQTRLLKTSVMLCGMSLLPLNPTTLSITSNLIERVTFHLSLSHSANTLETLQSLLVLLTGLPNPLVIPGAPLFLKRISLLFFSLGIHLQPPASLPDDIKKQRTACLHAFVYISASQSYITFESQSDTIDHIMTSFNPIDNSPYIPPEHILSYAQSSWSILLWLAKKQSTAFNLKSASKFIVRLKFIASIAHQRLASKKQTESTDDFNRFSVILNLQYKFLICQFGNELPRLNHAEHSTLLDEITVAAASLIKMVHQYTTLLPPSQVWKFTLSACQYLITNYHSVHQKDHKSLTQSLIQARKVFLHLKSSRQTEYMSIFYLAILDFHMTAKRICLPAT
ncbi:hypothetical protein DSO57_1015421 [Entomophthora muscae]|uniref:Uncharacterized protein n=1 Tax=Entomophthora muscae TaxID=34485 RepID=A0ACC2T601_9FUNG|nr:hypothetical protein DSO57_1015421 [Entomophthora muscae]